MTRPASDSAATHIRQGVIELRLRTLGQLFNSLDPSPFHEKDLDRNAEEFIASWARDLSPDVPIKIVIHLDEPASEADPAPLVREAVRHFFEYEAELKARELRDLLRRGRASLGIGLLFVAACVTVGLQLVRVFGDRPLIIIIQESLLIAGWVAMWRPMEIFLYDWWPIRNARRLYERLSRAEVEIRVRNQP